jgi:hypothetical protein
VIPYGTFERVERPVQPAPRHRLDRAVDARTRAECNAPAHVLAVLPFALSRPCPRHFPGRHADRA